MTTPTYSSKFARVPPVNKEQPVGTADKTLDILRQLYETDKAVLLQGHVLSTLDKHSQPIAQYCLSIALSEAGIHHGMVVDYDSQHAILLALDDDENDQSLRQRLATESTGYVLRIADLLSKGVLPMLRSDVALWQATYLHQALSQPEQCHVIDRLTTLDLHWIESMFAFHGMSYHQRGIEHKPAYQSGVQPAVSGQPTALDHQPSHRNGHKSSRTGTPSALGVLP